MNLHNFRNVLAAGMAIGLGAISAAAAEDAAKGASATELASRLSELRQDGMSSVRLRMEIRGDTKTNLQILIKQRRTKAGSDVVYQVLWPKDRKGEAVLLSKPSSGPTTGVHFVPPNTFKKIEAGDANEALFGSDLAYEDVVDNFFGWDQQAIVGKEQVEGVECLILESKPGKVKSIYGKVKSWIDPRRNVPMRVEKYSTTGQPVRRIDTLRVVPSDGRQIPANLSVRGPGRGGGTILDGSKIRYDVKFSDRDFTPEGLKAGAGEVAAE